MRDVVILGVGMTPFGRHLDKSHEQLTQAAVRLALEDAGLDGAAIDMAVYANVIQGFFAGEMSIPGEYALRPLGISGVRGFHVEQACASSTVSLHLAVDYVKAGLAEVALVVGVEKLYSDDRTKRFAVFQQPRDMVEAAAYIERTRDLLAPVPADKRAASPNVLMEAYAAQARLHMGTYGSTQAQIAAVAAKDHRHSQFNPLAQYREAMSVEEILAAPQVAWPLTNPMCAPISDGAAAAIVCSADFAKRFPGTPIRVLAAENRTGSDRAPHDYADHVTRKVAALAYERAGVGPQDVDLAEVHDASSIGEMIQTEALGLCAPGEAGLAAERGETALGGRVPVNVSGGLVSKGHPLAATGLGQIHELVTQLRGQAGKRQVEGARVAVAENSGGFYGVEDGMSAVTILARD
ncbi:thiolase family protein [Novosphingobium resinovorum]|uniref:thiolase family protein n=1 Tax=Novosphingobium TaxID=165696 RepID=UPI001B3C5E9D|nr:MULTISPECIES: thiolase family protein [Novosphingobium]MBF7013376.1 thiolase family protein [Novosphingobium sp. HR1a]WJM25527.1 thiolase family protein [Novosphingobium resinovorum]